MFFKTRRMTAELRRHISYMKRDPPQGRWKRIARRKVAQALRKLWRKLFFVLEMVYLDDSTNFMSSCYYYYYYYYDDN